MRELNRQGDSGRNHESASMNTTGGILEGGAVGRLTNLSRMRVRRKVAGLAAPFAIRKHEERQDDNVHIRNIDCWKVASIN